MMCMQTDQDDERPFNTESVTQVNIKTFRTTGMNYCVQFTNALADVEISSLHEWLHEIFQQILDETIGRVAPQDQVRVVLHSNQLEYPITFPFMIPEHTERIFAEFERVIQYNQEFHLNDTVDVNVIHVTMPTGGKNRKRWEVNLENILKRKSRLFEFKTKTIWVWQERLSSLMSSLITILATVKYEIPIDHCKRVWHKNSTKTPAYLSDRVALTKLNNFKRT